MLLLDHGAVSVCVRERIHYIISQIRQLLVRSPFGEKNIFTIFLYPRFGIQNGALGSTFEEAIFQNYDGKWKKECLNTGFLPISTRFLYLMKKI